jgi:hypothetical protein
MRAATLIIEPVERAIRLRLDLPERDAGEPLQREFRQVVDGETLRALEESAAALFRARGGDRFAAEARRVGTMLYRTLVPEALRADLRALRAPLVVASSLTGLPWQLVHDDEEHWGIRYALGTRLVRERAVAVRDALRRERPRALVVGADPLQDLPSVATEIAAVCDVLERRADVVCITDRLATFDRVVAHLGEGFDVVHFCGHVVRDESGVPALLLADAQRLPATVIEANLVGRPLVFVNGCASAQAAASSASVADAFLHGGAVAVVGTAADVADEHAAQLATAFYREALGGAPLGSALREARAEVRESAPGSAAWLAFVLYGNPAQALAREDTPKVVPLRPSTPAAAPVTLPVEPPRTRSWRWLALVAVLIALALAARLGREWARAPAGPVAVGVMNVRARGTAVPDWMRALTRDTLNTVLSRVPQVQVYSRQKIDFLREKRGLTEMEAAEALGMTKLLDAAVGVEGAAVMLEVEIVDTSSGVLQDTARVQGPREKLLELQTELALRVLTALGVHPSPEELRAIVAERTDATVEAYRLLSETLGGSGKPRPGPEAPAVPAPGPAPGPGSSWLEFGTRAYAQTPEQDDASIRELLRRYAQALESKQPDALAAIQVTMDDAQRSSLARYFAIARDLRVAVRDVDALVEGADAVVTFTREDTFTDAPSGRPMRLEVRVSGRLVKQDGAWKIQSLGDPS